MSRKEPLCYDSTRERRRSSVETNGTLPLLFSRGRGAKTPWACSFPGVAALIALSVGVLAVPSFGQARSRRTAVDFDRLSAKQRKRLRKTATVRAIQRVRRAVIAITTTKATNRNPFYSRSASPYGHRRNPRSTSLGSGVIVNAQGYAVTNEHVVSRATDITVKLADGRRYKAKVVGAARQFDLAVIKIKAGGKLPVARLGHSNDLMAGETVIAIGNPFGLSFTVSRGVISALKRKVKIKGREYSNFIQTDAAINPGNSGGPLINIVGEVIGINTAIHRGGPGISFAIPVDRVRRVIRDLLKYGRVRGAYVGISVYNYRGPGVAVDSVVSGGPAAEAGIRRGDIILRMRGRRIVDVHGFRKILSRLVPGERVAVRLRRGKVMLRVGSITAEVARKLFERRLGIKVDSAAYYARRMRLQTRDGAVIRSVDPQGKAYRVGLRTGDVIKRIDRYTIRSLRELDKAVSGLRTGRSIVMVVQRGSNSYYVTVPY